MTAGEDGLCCEGDIREAVVFVIKGLRRLGLAAATVRTMSLFKVDVTVTELADVVPVVVLIADILLLELGKGLGCVCSGCGTAAGFGESFDEPTLVMTLVGILGRLCPAEPLGTGSAHGIESSLNSNGFFIAFGPGATFAPPLEKFIAPTGKSSLAYMFEALVRYDQTSTLSMSRNVDDWCSGR